ncbi:MAG: patatin-like phospholipase family protein [Hyphomicrobiaceae bacterium]|nr:patatin-like phospholipase family protein [Hyphomicrobiaceae bacterium]
MERDQHLFREGPKRILSLDGGGVRGLISLGILARVEALLRERVPEDQRAAFRLCNYFDLIGGTSTGALIAVQLAFGETVQEITERYRDLCPKLFSKPRKLEGWWSRHDGEVFDKAIRDNLKSLVVKYGHNPEIEPDLDTSLLRTGLAVVTKRINTGSVWVQTNNPRHKYWDRSSPLWADHWQRTKPGEKFYANRSYPLSKIVLASASAPYYFDPVKLDVDQEQIGVFLDGGVSPFNDPSSELFMMAALSSVPGSVDAADNGTTPHGFNWPSGRDNIYMLSVGAGTYRVKHDATAFRKLSAAKQGIEALKGLIVDAQKNTRTWMQAVSVPPRTGSAIEVQHLIDSNLGAMRGLKLTAEPLLTYRRADATIDQTWLSQNLGLDYTDNNIKDLRELDCHHRTMHDRCLEIGRAVGSTFVNEDDFPASFDLDGWQQPVVPVRLFATVG